MVGFLKPHKLNQSWECTFLKLSTHWRQNEDQKKVFINGLQNYQLACTTSLATQGWIGPFHHEDPLIKKDFIIGLQNYQIACTANPALIGRIGHTC